MQTAYQVPESGPVLVLRRATLVFKADMGYGYTTIQARDVEVRIGRYAQYAAAVFCSFTPRGKRSQRAIVGTYAPGLVILDGWVDPQVPDTHHAPVDGGNGVTVQAGRALSCSPMWTQEALAAAQATGKVVADYHEHDAKERKAA
jgi:hypothetical protein